MYFRINEVSTIAANGNTYVHVDFWRRRLHFNQNQSPYLTNTFLMHLRPMQGVRRRKDGFFERTDGSYVSPTDATRVSYEDFRYERGWDVRQQMLDAIVAYWRRARKAGFSGDHTEDTTKPLRKNGTLVRQGTSLAITRDNSDPNRVLERSDIVGLRNLREDRPGES